MNHRERFVRTLTGKPVDRVPFIKVFGGTNAVRPHWEAEAPGISRNIDKILRFEGVYRGWDIVPVNFGMTRRGAPHTVEENAAQVVRKFDDGTVEILLKGGDYHHQTVEWPVKSMADWRRIKARHLQPDDPERYPADWPKLAQAYRNRDYPLQLTHGGVYGSARNLMGDEALLYAFYDAPELVHEIMDSYTDMTLAIWERLTRDVEFDLIEFWEDMASKNGCLISPETFREFMLPNYLRVAAFAKEHGIEIILVDSDGYIDDLAAVMLEAGVTVMYPFEAGAGCDVAKVRRQHPTLGMIGGLAKESMIYGKDAIDREMEKAREYIKLGRFIPGPDHFVLSNVSWENYRYFMERLREVVMTTSPASAGLAGTPLGATGA
jgi:uroporphyrinogen decarboxylase